MIFNQTDCIGSHRHCPNGFFVALVPYIDNSITLLRTDTDLVMDFGDKRTHCIYYVTASLPSFPHDFRC
tara:strand:- start:471 stop:677 length:207 start_codon:yes stop_codon:yes gene_type:complete